MRILLFGNLTSTHFAKWANSLDKRGHSVMVVGSPEPMKSSIRFNESVKIHQLKIAGKKGYYLNVFEVKKIVKLFKPDVVNAQYASGMGTLCRLAGIHPLVISCYGSDVFEYPFQNKYNMYNIRKNLLYADAIGSTSNAMAQQVRLLLSNPQMEVTVTPFGVDVERFSPECIKKEKKQPVIGIVKYLEPIYDIPLLLNAFSIVYNRLEVKPILRIYGDGYLKEELESLAKRLNIASSVCFYGLISNDEVPNVIKEMDIFVNSSVKESFGVNMVEAMACGVPVVATDTAGANEVIEADVTGVILKDRNPETMANAFEDLLVDDNKRALMGKAGRERVLELYNWDKNVITMEQLYQSVMK